MYKTETINTDHESTEVNQFDSNNTVTHVATETEWEVPVYLEDYTLPEFPLEVFPPIIKEMICAVAEFTQTPKDMAALIAIGTLSTALTKKFEVIPRKGWIETLNTYTMLLMDASSRKSAVFQYMTAPLRRYEKEWIEEMKPIVEKRRVERNTLVQQIKDKQKEFIKTNMVTVKHEINALIDESYKIPEIYLPSLILEDATPDGLERQLRENQERIALLSADGSLIENIKKMKLPLLIKGYSGDPYGNGNSNEKLENPLITICMAAHPGILTNLPAAMRENGYTTRFLYAVPNKNIGYRNSNPAAIRPNILSQYNCLVAKVSSFTTRNPIPLRLDEAGKKILEEMLIKIEKELRAEETFQEGVIHWKGKLVGNLIRVAGLLHISSYAEKATAISDIPTIINHENLEAAFKLEGYFMSHAEKAHGVMHQNSTLSDAIFIWNKLKQEKEMKVSRQAIWQKTKKAIATAHRLDAALAILESRNYLKRSLEGKSGRKEFLELNPYLFKTIPILTSNLIDQSSFKFSG